MLYLQVCTTGNIHHTQYQFQNRTFANICGNIQVVKSIRYHDDVIKWKHFRGHRIQDFFRIQEMFIQYYSTFQICLHILHIVYLDLGSYQVFSI